MNDFVITTIITFAQTTNFVAIFGKQRAVISQKGVWPSKAVVDLSVCESWQIFFFKLNFCADRYVTFLSRCFFHFCCCFFTNFANVASHYFFARKKKLIFGQLLNGNQWRFSALSLSWHTHTHTQTHRYERTRKQIRFTNTHTVSQILDTQKMAKALCHPSCVLAEFALKSKILICLFVPMRNYNMRLCPHSG